jgi:carboxymethylenebutenolidase
MERNPKLPAGEEQAKAALNASPRHGEYVDVPVQGVPVRTWVVYPERRDKAPVVIVIHEIFGLSDWIRGVADQLAAEGFIAVAPDLISGRGPNGGGTDSVPARDDVVKLVRDLTPADVDARLNAVRAWALGQPSASGKSATIGFCWGGGTSFRYAVTQPALDAAVVYYGTAPDAAALGTIHAPVLGFYGGDDARVTSTVAPTETAMKAAGKSYESHIFDGAGHGFLRAQSDRSGANLRATEQAWPRTVEFIRQHAK